MSGNNSKVMVTLKGEGKPRTYKALLDTGNNLMEGIAISPKTHSDLGAAFTKLGGIVKSAGKANLKVKGLSAPIELRFKDTVYRVKPVVIEGLRDEVNIGRELLNRANIGLSYGKVNAMTSSEGEVPMIRAIEKAPGAAQGRTQQKTGAIKRETPELPTPVTAQ